MLLITYAVEPGIIPAISNWGATLPPKYKSADVGSFPRLPCLGEGTARLLLDGRFTWDNTFQDEVLRDVPDIQATTYGSLQRMQ